jgi:hypothetical protein
MIDGGSEVAAAILSQSQLQCPQSRHRRLIGVFPGRNPPGGIIAKSIAEGGELGVGILGAGQDRDAIDLLGAE